MDRRWKVCEGLLISAVGWREGEARLEARGRRPAFVSALAAVVVLSGWVGAAAGVTVDGRIGPGEWAGAEVVITDPRESGMNADYDAHRIMMEDGAHQLYVAVTVYGDHPGLAAAGSSRPYLNFYFNLYAGGTAPYRFGLTYNDGYGFPSGQMHLVQYDNNRWTDLGVPNFAIDQAVEVGIPWAMLSAELTAREPISVQDMFFLYNVAPGDANGDGAVNYLDLGMLAGHYRQFHAEWSQGDFNLDGVVDYQDLGIFASHYRYQAPGGADYDIFDEWTMVDRNMPLTNHAPEPATVVGGIAGLAALACYLRKRRLPWLWSARPGN